MEVFNSYIENYAASESHTAKAKRYDLSHFLNFLSKKKKIEELLLSDWSFQATVNFIEERLKIGDSPASVNRRIASLKHLGKILAERFPGFVNPAKEVKAPKIANTKPQSLSSVEVSALIKTAEIDIDNDNSFRALRNKTIIQTILNTGLRADEVRTLRIGQVSPQLDWFKNVRTKGRNYRNIFLNSALKSQIVEYLQRRDQELREKLAGYGTLGSEAKSALPFFVSIKGATISNPDSLCLSPKTIWRIISGMGLRADVELGENVQEVYPHLLRHTFAHKLLNETNDVRIVAQALGHSDVRVTMRYTERSDEELAEAMEKIVKK